LILPVGLEKRIYENLDELAAKMNEPGKQGPRLWPVPGEIFTELDAIRFAYRRIRSVSRGGWKCVVREGSIWLAVSGKPAQEKPQKILLNLSSMNRRLIFKKIPSLCHSGLDPESRK